MNILKIFYTLTLCCAVALTSDTVAAGKSGNDTMNKNNPGYGGQGMTTEIQGKIESYNKQDSMLIIKNQRMDTVFISETTEIMINGKIKKASDLKTGTMVSVWYEMQNGKKVATVIMEPPNPNGSHDMNNGTGKGGASLQKSQYTPSDTMPGMPQQGKNPQMRGKIVSFDTIDSMLILQTTNRMDTVAITGATTIMINGQQKTTEHLKPGKNITVSYEMQNGRKVATMITDTMGAGKGGSKSCPNRGYGGSGYDTSDTGGMNDTAGIRR